MTFERITIVGAGAIGGWIAAKLALAGSGVSVLVRGETLRRIAAEGLLLSEAGEEQSAAIAASDDPSQLGEQDLAVIAVKAPALPALAGSLEPLIGSRTVIVPMLNGVPWWFVEGQPLGSVDPDGSIAAARPFGQVAGCVVHASCSRAAPNRILVKHADKLILGEPRGGTSERIQGLCALFEAVGI